MAERVAPVGWGWAAAFAAMSMAVGLLAGIDPKFAIAASIGIGFVLIVFADLTAGLALFGFFSFLEVLHLGSAVSVGKLGGSLLALGWIAFVVTRNDAKSDFLGNYPAISLVLGLFLGWVAISALWAENTAATVGDFGRYLPNVILFLIVFTAVRNLRQATLVIGAFLAGAAAACIYGLFFVSTEVRTGYTGRLTGTALDPNELAAVLVAGMALSLGLAGALKRQPLLRLAALTAGGFCFLTAMLTGSRGGLLALAVMLVAAIVFGGRWRTRTAVVSILVAVLAVFYVTSWASPEIRDRILSSSQGEERLLEPRTTLWEIGRRMVRANPVTGVGAGNFQNASRHYLLQPGSVYRSDFILETPGVAHNTYLHVASELGFVGLGLFGTIVIFSLACNVRAVRNFGAAGEVSGEALARGVTIALVGVLVADYFISQQFNKQLWLLLGIGPALLAISRRSLTQAATADQPSSFAAKSSS